jgi:tellurite resistance protein TehA-like permease
MEVARSDWFPGRAARILEDVLAIRPNWFTSVMGTGIVAVVAATLVPDVPGTADLAVAFWLLSAIGLAVLATLAVPALRDGGIRRFADDPHTAPFLGTVPMAALTVATATVLAGSHVIGLHVALVVAVLLWVPAAVGAVVAAIGLPLHATHRAALRVDPGHPPWILAAVPPLTAAAGGTVFVPHLHAGLPRDAFVGLCLALGALGLGGALAAIRLVLRRMRRVGLGPVRSIPTLWLVIGPLGQATTAVVLLAADERVAHVPSVALGLAIWCAALGWLAFALGATVWAAFHGLPFSLAWWGFTFPVGTVALGTNALAAATGAPALGWVGAALLGLLLTGWTCAAAGTARNAWQRRAARLAPA